MSDTSRIVEFIFLEFNSQITFVELCSQKFTNQPVDRFSTIFSYDSDSMPRVWTGKEDIRAITKTARSSV